MIDTREPEKGPEEISRELGIHRRTLEKRCQRALRKLRIVWSIREVVGRERLAELAPELRGLGPSGLRSVLEAERRRAAR